MVQNQGEELIIMAAKEPPNTMLVEEKTLANQEIIKQ